MSARSEYMKARPKPADGEKRSKESVNYSKGTMSEHCGICKHFQTPNGCELVEGHIVPSFWCRLFAKSKIVKFGALRRK